MDNLRKPPLWGTARGLIIDMSEIDHLWNRGTRGELGGVGQDGERGQESVCEDKWEEVREREEERVHERAREQKWRQGQGQCVPSEAREAAPRPSPDEDPDHELQGRAQYNYAMPALRLATATLLPDYGRLTGEIAAELRLDFKRWRIGLSRYKATIVYLGACQLEGVWAAREDFGAHKVNFEFSKFVKAWSLSGRTNRPKRRRMSWAGTLTIVGKVAKATTMTGTLCLDALSLHLDLLPMMAPSKKEIKQKEMFKPYDATAVPDAMPFPTLLRVATTKTEETAVPRLNQYQRSWIFDNALRGTDLAGLQSKLAISGFYEKVKSDAFEAKAFQHTPQPGDTAEEASLPGLIAAWKRDNPKKDKKQNNKLVADDGDASDDEEDEGAHVGLLRGYTKAGWRLAIQKVLTNKRTADKKRKVTKTDNTELVAVVPALAMAKVFGLASSTGHDKFRQERHDEINAHSKTLPGVTNPGGKFRKAEAQLWANEDQAKWESAAEADEDVDWEERQKLPTGAVHHMVDTLNASGKFRPFLATMLMGWLDEQGEIQFGWVEALPKGVDIRQRFEDQYPQLVTSGINAMYAWAKMPLQDYAAARDGSSRPVAPVFPVSAEALDDMSPNMVAQTVTVFLLKSYKAAFRDENIPWPAITTAPDQYYDVGKFELVFSSSGLQGFKGAQWHGLGAVLAAGAGEGSSGFFRKGSAVTCGEEGEEEAERSKRKLEEEDARVQEAARKEEEGARVREAARKEEEEEAERLKRRREEENARVREAARKEEEEEAERLKRKREEDARVQKAARKEEEEKEAERVREEEARQQRRSDSRGTRRRKRHRRRRERRVESARRRRLGLSQRKEEAEAERQKKMAAATAGKRKPGYSYIEKTPVKKGRGATRTTLELQWTSSPRRET
ncbi:hypothetical protein DFH09DRAFT_1077885 [Mycena vulgaris]|nr:hypothetical protein DFH09DRAFT_1077885 [Mycena vulgaris]